MSFRGRLLALFCAAALNVSCVSAGDDDVAKTWRAIDLSASAYQLRGDKAADEAFAVGAFIYRGGLHLQSEAAPFGGYSGLTISNDGRRILAVSDRAHWLSASLTYGADDRLRGVGNARIANVTGVDGEALTGDLADAEALYADGSLLFVGFERHDRIDVYEETPDGGISFLRNAADFSQETIPFNKGPEAIAPMGKDGVIAFAEAAPSPSGGTVTWIIDAHGAHRALSYHPAKDFSPTDAARLPNGDLLVLERAFSPSIGPRARLVHLSASALKSATDLRGTELARFAAPLVVDNMEGLAIREAADGRIFIYLISDDNQNPRRQKTILMMFELSGIGAN